MPHGKNETDGTVSETREKKGDFVFQARLQNELASQSIEDAVKAVMAEPKLQELLKADSPSGKVTKGQALQLLISWGADEYTKRGFGSDRGLYSNQSYAMIDAQVKDMMRGLKNILENCDKGIEANQKNCAEKVHQTEEKLALVKSEYESILDDKSEYIIELETSNADLSDKNSALIKENEALISLRDAHDKNSEAWDKEREGLSERIVQLQHASEENVQLLKDQQKYETMLADLKKEMNDLRHQHQLLTKEAEIGFQKTLASATANAAAEAEQKLRHTLGPVVSDLKSQISDLTEQLKAERDEAQSRVKAARAEERAAAGEEISRLQEILKREIESVQSAQALVLSTKSEKKKKRGRPISKTKKTE